jgi:hypothetical protein
MICPRHGRWPVLECSWCQGRHEFARWDVRDLGDPLPPPYKWEWK